MNLVRLSNRVLAASIGLSALVMSTQPLFSQDYKRAFTAGGTIVGGNEFYRVYVQDLPGEGVGLYTATTGPSHPAGSGLNVLYGDGDPGTTFNTIRSFTTGTDYVQSPNNTSSNPRVYLDPYGLATPLDSIGARTVYILPGPPITPDALTIIQDVVVNGTTFADSTIEVTTAIINRGTNPVELGIRYLWDYQIALDDGPTFQALFPDGPVLMREAEFVQPAFEAYRIEDNDRNPSPPTFNILGGVNTPGTVVPNPISPDLLQFTCWVSSFGTAFDYSVNTNLNITTTASSCGGSRGGDVALIYYFGRDQSHAIVIPAGQTNRVTTIQFLTPRCTLVCQSDILATNAPDQCGASVSYSVPSVSARCGSVTCTPPPGTFFPIGTNIVTCSLTNGSSCSFAVIVVDGEPPVITCPTNVTVGSDGNYPLPEASDRCGTATVTCVPPPGSAFSNGVTSVVCTAQDASGNTNTCTFEIRVGGPRSNKQAVLADLRALRATLPCDEPNGDDDDDDDGDEDHDCKKLDEAIKHLTKSLAPELWVDETHLQRKHGEKVFHEEKEAAHKLLELIKDEKSEIPDGVLHGFIDRLVAADRLLAEVAIAEAEAAGVNPKKIAHARKELEKAEEELAKGHPDHAIEHYGHAWKEARQAKIQNLLRLPNGSVDLEILGFADESYVIQTSTNLNDWVDLGEHSAGQDGELIFKDTNPGSGSMRFYRILEP